MRSRLVWGSSEWVCESFQNDLISTSLLLKELKEQEEVVPCLNHQAHKIPPDDRYFWPPRAVGVQEPETGVHSMLILTRCTNVFTEAQYPAQCSTSHRRDSLDVSSRYNCVLYNQHIVPQLAHQTWLIRVSLLDLKKFTEWSTHTQFRSGESSSKLCNSEDVPFALRVGDQKIEPPRNSHSEQLS